MELRSNKTTREVKTDMVEKTQFQIDCERALNLFLSQNGLALQEREEVETAPSRGFGTYILIKARIKDCTIWIYDNQADIKRGERAIVLEQLDYQTPQDLIDAFIARLKETLL
jgi:hypothetical protein